MGMNQRHESMQANALPVGHWDVLRAMAVRIHLWGLEEKIDSATGKALQWATNICHNDTLLQTADDYIYLQSILIGGKLIVQTPKHHSVIRTVHQAMPARKTKHLFYVPQNVMENYIKCY